MRTSVAIASLLAAPAALANPPVGSYRIVAIEGDVYPGVPGTLQSFQPPLLNNRGEAAFHFTAGANQLHGVGVATPSFRTLPMFEGMPSPDGNGQIQSITSGDGGPSPVPIGLDDSGRVYSKVFFTNSAAGNDDDEALLRAGPSSSKVLAREGWTAPGGVGVLDGYFRTPRANQLGEMACSAGLRDRQPGYTQFANTMLFNDDGPHAVFYPFYTAPGTQTYGSDWCSLNDSGQVSYIRSGLQNFIHVPQEIVIGSVNGDDFVAVFGDPIPGEFPWTVGLNDHRQWFLANSGQIYSGVTLSLGGTGDLNSGVREVGPFGIHTLIIETADTGDFQSGPQAVAGEFGVVSTGLAVFRFQGTSFDTIVQNGDVVLGGQFPLAAVGDNIAVNRSGQIAFTGVGISSQIVGSILFDDPTLGLHLVAGPGVPMLGSTISRVWFEADEPGGEEQNGFNDRGEVAFKFSLADGREGIAIWSLDPPSMCPADVNYDGIVSPADFNAWIIAFNTLATACDQNGDGLCNPADFSAWILNYNSGC